MGGETVAVTERFVIKWSSRRDEHTRERAMRHVTRFEILPNGMLLLSDKHNTTRMVCAPHEWRWIECIEEDADE